MMIEPWVFWGMVVSLGAAVARIVTWSNSFRTKKECSAIRKDCDESHQIYREGENEKRKEIWNKIDQIHKWLVEGTIVVRRTDTH